MKKLILVLLTAAIFTIMVASPVSAAPLPADEACAKAIPRAQAAGVTLPFNLCFNLP